MNLDDVLSDKPIERQPIVDEPATDVKPVETPSETTAAAPSAATEAESPAKEPEQKASTQRDEKGRFTKTEAAAPIAALIEERRKRQEAEARLQQYEAQKPKTDFFEDPAKATTEHVREAVSPLEREVLDLKVQLQRLKNPDFDEVMMLVLEKAQGDQLLKHQIDSSPDPLTFIYREGKRIKELADVDGDIGKYRDKVTAEERQRYADLETRYKALEAEVNALKAAQDKRAKVPQSLNAENSAPSSTPTFSGPRPIASILNS
jgi:hypothetical protein